MEDVAVGTQALDLSAKFGASLARYDHLSGQSSAIPSATEIAEKKARRARLAREEAAEYISLDPDDPNLDDDDDEDLDENVMRNERGQLVLKPKEDKYGLSESRLVHEDEDIMENFDEFTEDGKISLGKKAEAEAARKRKQDMAAQIAEAEGASDAEDSDDSERARTDAFVANQTRHGIYNNPHSTTTPAAALDLTAHRPKTPPIITPLPTVTIVAQRLEAQLASMQAARTQKLQEMRRLQREKIDLAEQEVRIQQALKETAEKFSHLRKEKGIGEVVVNADVVVPKSSEQGYLAIEEAAVATPPPPGEAVERGGEALEKDMEDREDEEGEEKERQEEEEVDVDVEEEEDERPAFGGLGLGGAGRPNLAGFGLGYSNVRDDEDER